VDSFDAAQQNWTLQTPGPGYTAGGGVLNAPNGTVARMTADDLALGAEQDLFVSTRVNFAAQGGSGGVLFGWQDESNFFELRAVDGRGAGGDVDVRLVRRAGGVETNLIEVTDRVNVGTTNNEPPIQAGWFTTVVDYAAGTGRLELWVVRPDGAPFWRGEWALSAPLAVGSRCGVVAREPAGMQLDDFIALAYQPVDIATPDAVRLSSPAVNHGQFQFNWASTPDAKYRISSRSGFQVPWSQVATGVVATPPTNTYVHPMALLPAEFFKVEEGL
jgi:hypothetical protein